MNQQETKIMKRQPYDFHKGKDHQMIILFIQDMESHDHEFKVYPSELELKKALAIERYHSWQRDQEFKMDGPNIFRERDTLNVKREEFLSLVEKHSLNELIEMVNSENSVWKKSVILTLESYSPISVVPDN